MSIFDPYFCVGTTKKLLGSLGFFNVGNECEDFYAQINEGRIPPHEVLVTGPPYADVHLQRLLRFCSAHDKPYFLLMPDYVSKARTFLPSLNAIPSKPVPIAASVAK